MKIVFLHTGNIKKEESNNFMFSSGSNDKKNLYEWKAGIMMFAKKIFESLQLGIYDVDSIF